MAPQFRASNTPAERRDSRWIAFESFPPPHPDDPVSDDVEVLLISADGGQPRCLTMNGRKDSLGGWSRDGRRLYFHQGSRDPDQKRWDNRIYWVEPNP